MCGECDKIFTMQARVKRHSRNKHKYLRKTCEICDNTFKKPAWLKKHQGSCFGIFLDTWYLKDTFFNISYLNGIFLGSALPPYMALLLARLVGWLVCVE